MMPNGQAMMDKEMKKKKMKSSGKSYGKEHVAMARKMMEEKHG